MQRAENENTVIDLKMSWIATKYNLKTVDAAGKNPDHFKGTSGCEVASVSSALKQSAFKTRRILRTIFKHNCLSELSIFVRASISKRFVKKQIKSSINSRYNFTSVRLFVRALVLTRDFPEISLLSEWKQKTMSRNWWVKCFAAIARD